jgi:uncharacterized protein YdhG (YjbR/CyaY superfamily)
VKRTSASGRRPRRAAAAEIDAYLASLPAPARAGLQKLRRAIAAAAPDAEEGISYGIPAFRLAGHPLVWFAAFARHSSFFPGAAAIREHAADLRGYHTSKGTVQFPPDRPPPARLVARLVKTRMAELRVGRPTTTRGTTDRDFRRIALSLPHATEAAHMGHPDFRVGGKIFATLGYPRRGWATVKLTPEQQELFVRTQATTFTPAQGAWGLAGSTTVRLASAGRRALEEAVRLAWLHRAPKRLADLAEPEYGRPR